MPRHSLLLQPLSQHSSGSRPPSAAHHVSPIPVFSLRLNPTLPPTVWCALARRGCEVHSGPSPPSLFVLPTHPPHRTPCHPPCAPQTGCSAQLCRHPLHSPHALNIVSCVYRLSARRYASEGMHCLLLPNGKFPLFRTLKVVWPSRPKPEPSVPHPHPTIPYNNDSNNNNNSVCVCVCACVCARSLSQEWSQGGQRGQGQSCGDGGPATEEGQAGQQEQRQREEGSVQVLAQAQEALQKPALGEVPCWRAFVSIYECVFGSVPMMRLPSRVGRVPGYDNTGTMSSNVRGGCRHPFPRVPSPPPHHTPSPLPCYQAPRVRPHARVPLLPRYRPRGEGVPVCLAVCPGGGGRHWFHPPASR
jgi:hypothetical protein